MNASVIVTLLGLLALGVCLAITFAIRSTLDFFCDAIEDLVDDDRDIDCRSWDDIKRSERGGPNA